jgi:hypothetical protein
VSLAIVIMLFRRYHVTLLFHTSCVFIVVFAHLVEQLSLLILEGGDLYKALCHGGVAWGVSSVEYWLCFQESAPVWCLCSLLSYSQCR